MIFTAMKKKWGIGWNKRKGIFIYTGSGSNGEKITVADVMWFYENVKKQRYRFSKTALTMVKLLS